MKDSNTLTKNNLQEVPFNLARMIKALASESFTMPTGLNREEKRQFIKDCANGKIKPNNQ